MLVSGSADRTLRVWNLESRRCVAVLRGHIGTVEAVDALGDCVVSGGADGTVRVWCLITMRCTRTFKAHTGQVAFVRIVDPFRLVTVSNDGQLRVWRYAHHRKFGKQEQGRKRSPA